MNCKGAQADEVDNAVIPPSIQSQAVCFCNEHKFPL